MRLAAVLLCAGLAASACSGTAPGPAERARPTTEAGQSSGESEGGSVGEPASPNPDPAVSPADFEAPAAMEVVRHLAGVVGPRHATSDAYDSAADWVAGRFEALGLDVRRQDVEVPGGLSWGVPVGPGRSVNVIAAPPSYRPGRPHLVVGAHLDTVPQAPGAEDNASGVGVLLAAAEAVAGRSTRLPVLFVAFGAEEPRGDTDADHHYGSRTFVASLTPRARRAMRGMVSLDRVGVGDVVPIGSAHEGATRVAEQLLRAGRQAGVPVVRELNRSSDHWQFVQAGLPGARLGSTPYAAYHSAQDVPAVIERSQLRRTGRLLLRWLAP